MTVLESSKKTYLKLSLAAEFLQMQADINGFKGGLGLQILLHPEFTLLGQVVLCFFSEENYEGLLI